MFEAGGGGINVSRALRNFKTDSLCIYISGGYTGRILNNLVYHEQLNAEPVSSTAYTRENFIVFENQTHLQFRFGMPVNPVPKKEWQEVITKLKKQNAKYLVLSGSVWPDIDRQFFSELQKYIKKNKVNFVVDTAGNALRTVLKTGAFLIKPNQNEFSQLFGKKQLNAKQIVARSKQLIKQGMVKNILVSLGGEGAVLINEKEATQFIPPKLKIKSTVGAGDTMVAGIVYQLNKGQTISEAVKFGVACGSATSINSGMQLGTLSGAKNYWVALSKKTRLCRKKTDDN
ncbi:MAG: 1-phosphofructokinase family hexose kinase [Sphingobacteriaceae bacterium]|nr:1-phosphofructokinase family hexose kinase [Sphingobacteriaceae bacterium]